MTCDHPKKGHDPISRTMYVWMNALPSPHQICIPV